MQKIYNLGVGHMIVKEQADKRIALKLLNHNKISIWEVQQIIIDHMKYLISNYKDLDDELKAICDKYISTRLKTH